MSTYASSNAVARNRKDCEQNMTWQESSWGGRTQPFIERHRYGFAVVRAAVLCAVVSLGLGVLGHAAPVTAIATISGTVVDDAGVPIAGATVRCDKSPASTTDKYGHVRFTEAFIGSSVTTAKDGSFSIPVCPRAFTGYARPESRHALAILRLGPTEHQGRSDDSCQRHESHPAST